MNWRRTERSIIKTYLKAGFKFDDYDQFSINSELTGYEEIIDTSNNFMDIHLVDDNEIETVDLSKISNKVSFCKSFCEFPSDYKKLFYDKDIAYFWNEYSKVMAIYNIFPTEYKLIRDGDEYEEVMTTKGIFSVLKEYNEGNLNLNEYPLQVRIFMKVVEERLLDIKKEASLYVVTDEEFAYIKQVLYQSNPLVINAGKEYSLILYLNTLMPFFFKPKKEDKVIKQDRHKVYDISYSYLYLLDLIIDHIYVTKKEAVYAFAD